MGLCEILRKINVKYESVLRFPSASSHFQTVTLMKDLYIRVVQIILPKKLSQYPEICRGPNVWVLRIQSM